MNAVWNLLSDGHRVDGELASRLVDALDRAWQCSMDTETRCVYIQTVEQLVKHHGNSLSSADMDRLMPGLVDVWKSQWSDSRLIL